MPPVRWRPAPARGVVWFHGNGEQLADETWLQPAMAARGLEFSGIEYPGYGMATGVGPSEGALFAAARAGLDLLAKSGRARPICVGASLGTGVAARMATEGRCSALALLAPYTSIAEVAQVT